MQNAFNLQQLNLIKIYQELNSMALDSTYAIRCSFTM